MTLFIITSIFPILLLALTIVLSIKACITTKDRDSKREKTIAIISALGSLLSAMIIRLPEPTIYPLDSETRASVDDIEITIHSDIDDFVKTYYSLDGTDPKDGYIYLEPIVISKSTTVCARNKFLWLWSEIDVRSYIVEEAQTSLSNSYPVKSDNEESDAFVDNQKKVTSIFDLDPIKGSGLWCIPTSEAWYTDANNNEYRNSHFATHYSTTKEKSSHVPTYLLDYKYSKCEGQIVWAKGSKKYEGSAWIEFYSGDIPVFFTEHITSDDQVITFSFPVDGLDTLTIVRNGTRSSNDKSIYVIYPYLNLIE